MKGHRAWAAASAAGVALALLLAACGGGSTYGKGSGKKSAASAVFTYDTYTQVMVDGWDPATEYSNGIIAMSNMYETLTGTTRRPTRSTRCLPPAGPRQT